MKHSCMHSTMGPSCSKFEKKNQKCASQHSCESIEFANSCFEDQIVTYKSQRKKAATCKNKLGAPRRNISVLFLLLYFTSTAESVTYCNYFIFSLTAVYNGSARLYHFTYRYRNQNYPPPPPIQHHLPVNTT